MAENLKKVTIEITEEDVTGFLQTQHFKVTPDVVTAVMNALKLAYQDDPEKSPIGYLIDFVLWDSREVTSRLESE